MKHPATGSHALGTRPPPIVPNPKSGSPGHVGSPARRPSPPVTITPISLPRLHSRGSASRKERRRTQGARRAAHVLVAVVLQYSRSASAGAGRGRAPLGARRSPGAFSCVARSGAGRLASRRAESAALEGKLRRGPLTPPLSQREARPPRRAARTRASSSLMEEESRLLPAGWARGTTIPSVQRAWGASEWRTSHVLPGARGGVADGPVVHAGRAHPALLATGYRGPLSF